MSLVSWEILNFNLISNYFHLSNLHQIGHLKNLLIPPKSYFSNNVAPFICKHISVCDETLGLESWHTESVRLGCISATGLISI